MPRKIDQETREALLYEAWIRGELSWKLHEHQKEIYSQIKNTKHLTFVLNCSRRIGKTTILLLDDIEFAIQNPKSNIGFIAPTQKMVIRILKPIFKTITEDCPWEMRPQWKTHDNAWYFENGSVIFCAGTDNQRYEDLRGMNLHRASVDEAGFAENLSYVLEDILRPATMTTEGQIIISSTPPKTAAHDFYYICKDAESKGNYIVRTLHDNTSLPKRLKDRYIEEAGGINSSTARREYFCEFVTDEESSVLPEFTETKAKKLVREMPRPECYDYYGSLDPGFKDFSGYLLGYYDFLGGYYVIVAEELMKRHNTAGIADKIKTLESEHFNDMKAFLRVSDTELQIIHDLWTLHEIQFVPTKKDNLDAQVNHLRNLILFDKIYIHPRCVHLIRQMKTAIWNQGKTQFERTKKEGHFDLVAALIYLIRNIDKYHNPYPDTFVPSDDTFNRKENRSESNLAKALLGSN